MSFATDDTAAPAFEWKRWPETEALVEGWVAAALEGNAFAAELAARMRDETNTRFVDWVDHLIVANQPGLLRRLQGLGYALEAEPYAVGTPVHGHPGGIFPRIVVASGAGGAVREVAI